MTRRWLTLAATVGGVMLARTAVRRRRTLALDGRVVLITGGSRGLGLVLARELVDRGARVAICARDEAELIRAARELEGRGPAVFAAVCDVTDRDAVLELVATVEDDVGPIDALVNCVGVLQVGPLELMTAVDFEHALDVNLRGPMHAMLAAAPLMRRRGAGRIVNVASIGGRIAIPHLAPYTASKFGLVGLSRAMRVELAKDGVYVTTVCPGLMRTGSAAHAWFKGEQAAELAWFSIADSLSLTSVSAEAAARRILDAMIHGDAELVISPQARIAQAMAAIAPTWMQELLGVVARIMPAAGPGASRAAAEGKDIDAPLVPSVLTKQGDAAARRNNEN